MSRDLALRHGLDHDLHIRAAALNRPADRAARLDLFAQPGQGLYVRNLKDGPRAAQSRLGSAVTQHAVRVDRAFHVGGDLAEIDATLVRHHPSVAMMQPDQAASRSSIGFGAEPAPPIAGGSSVWMVWDAV